MIEIDKVCSNIRKSTVESICNFGGGHIGGSLSLVELLAVLYFNKMNIDPQNPKAEGRDRLILSKGHAGPVVYATLVEKGYFPKSELATLNILGTNLPSHCDMNKTIGIDMTTGSLGQGFSCAVGIAIASKIKKDNATIYTIIGDGESQEGQIWEGAMLASHKKLNNLLAFTDHNKLQIDGTVDQICTLGELEEKWRAFGWYVQRVNGHDCEEIGKAIDEAKKQKEKPSMIILDTIKGKGVSFVEAAGVANHNMVLTKEQIELALAEVQGEMKTWK